jgi:uncharacterized protein YcfJ
MRTNLASTLVLIAATSAFVAAPMIAEAKTRHRVQICDSNVRKKANNGTAVGAVSGGLLGNLVAGHGAKTEGTVLGAGVGAVVGHSIAKNNAKGNCHYEYRYY